METLSDDADIQAMRRLQGGDDLALNEIMNRWQKRVFTYLLRFLNSESSAQDLAEETFVRIYQNRHRYRPTGRFSTWIFAIAANLARHHLRWLARHPAVSIDAPTGGTPSLAMRIPSDEPSPSDRIEQQEKLEEVRRAVRELPPDLREAIVLFEYESLSYEEIAAIASCSKKAVETRLYRARAFLRDKLRHWLAPSP